MTRTALPASFSGFLERAAAARANKGAMPGDAQRQTNRNAKLTPERVAEIRASTDTDETLAARFGVAVSTINGVRSGTSWIGVAPAVQPGATDPAAGSRHGKLTPEQITDIRILKGQGTTRAVAARFGVHATTISGIWTGERHANLA